MITKYKVSEVAKDFGLQNKDIIDVLAKHFEEPKKSQTALDTKELDVLFDVLTQENSVENFNAYFAMKKQEEKKPEKKKKNKGFIAFIVILAVVVVGVVGFIAYWVHTHPSAEPEKHVAGGDDTQIVITESPVPSGNSESLTTIQIAEKAEKINVGIMIYGKTPSFVSSSTTSLVGEGSGIVMSVDKSKKYTARF